MKGSFGPFGSFPIIDRQLVTDYAKPASDPEHQFFRIHMDIPISDSTTFGKIRTALESGNDSEVYTNIKSTLPSENPTNRRAYAVVDAALKPATAPPDTRVGRNVALGSFPIIDRQLVTDYAKPTSDPEHQFFRIHMDIPISDSTTFGKIRKALDSGNEGEVYADIKSTLPSQTPTNERALAVVDAALNVEPI
jgi:predicted protein tyrosine phosphatase